MPSHRFNKKLKWEENGRPYGSDHFEHPNGRYGARVMPDKRNGGFEWSIWVGDYGYRVLHDQGSVSTRAAAKKKALEKLKKIGGSF